MMPDVPLLCDAPLFRGLGGPVHIDDATRHHLGIHGERSMTKGTDMKMLGLIGGMGWESSAEHYPTINRGIRDRRGPTASARCLFWSFDFSGIEALQHRGDWEGLTERWWMPPNGFKPVVRTRC